jgi:hypothetical protein
VYRRAQPSYAENKECELWPSYEGANNWRISQLVARTPENKTGTRETNKCVLNAMKARIAMIIREGKIGAVATTDKAVMGYYVVEWLTEPYSLQEDTEGMAGMIGTGTMVADAIFYNRVGGAPYWYTQSRMKTVIEVRYVLQTGFEMDEISPKNPLPNTCSRKEAMQQKAKKYVSLITRKLRRRQKNAIGWNMTMTTTRGRATRMNWGARWRAIASTSTNTKKSTGR